MEDLNKKIEEFASKHDIKFNDINVLRQAFTHRSYLNENRDYDLSHNERLEFLGDAVLELVTTEFLFEKFPERPEGELTSIRASLVNTISISETSTELGVNDYLLLSRGEAKDTGRARQYILANTFEAIIGAIYLDSGYDSAKDFIVKNLLPKLDNIIENSLWLDAKSLFQEKAQEHTSMTPTYKTLNEEGPDHAKKFTAAVFIGDQKVVEGEGFSKQEAESDAARKGLKSKGWL